ncbi:hypothetical protein Tco_0741854 [Tanacetum coccineum]
MMCVLAHISTSELVEDGKEEDEDDDEEEDDEEEDEEIGESSDSDSKSEDAEDEGPTIKDEDLAPGDEGFAAGDEGPGEPLGLGYGALRCQEIALGEGRMPNVFEVGQGSGSVPEPERPERVSELRQPTLTTLIDLEDSIAYIDVPAYPPPAYLFKCRHLLSGRLVHFLFLQHL